MGTKNNPGKFDCYANADPDEPVFVLLGRDSYAPLLVRLWAIFRSDAGEDVEKVDEAFACAELMEQELRRRKKQAHEDDELLLFVTERLAEHPESYDGPCHCDECLTS